MARCVELGGTGTIMVWMRGYGLALNGRFFVGRQPHRQGTNATHPGKPGGGGGAGSRLMLACSYE